MRHWARREGDGAPVPPWYFHRTRVRADGVILVWDVRSPSSVVPLKGKEHFRKNRAFRRHRRADFVTSHCQSSRCGEGEGGASRRGGIWRAHSGDSGHRRERRRAFR